MPFNTIEAGIEALKQQMHQQCQLESDELYLPLLGRRFASSEATAEDLETSITDFTANTNLKRVCTLFGDGGSGKTFFFKQLTLKLLGEYTAEKPIPLFVTLPLLTDPIHSAIEETLTKIGFDATQLSKLKRDYSFVFILDGYDEIHQLQNLYTSNRLNEWNAKTIISCRSQYFYNKEHPNLYFMPIENEREQPHLLQTLYVAPFNQDQIKQYIEAYNNSGTLATLSYEALISVPGLEALITTPFLLKLALEASPEILTHYAAAPESERQQLTQTELYKNFIRRWFERQEQKLKESGLITEEMPDQKPIFWRYCQALALEMHRHNLSWLSAEDERFAVYFENDAETERLRSACPIKQTENRIGFWHESLGMHFVAQTIYQESLSNASTAIIPQQVSEGDEPEQERPQGAIHLRLVTDDPAALRVLADKVTADPKYKAHLFAIIEHSKTNEHYAVGAANAISALNAASVNFSGKNLQGICVPNANLTGALMPYTNLSKSNLSGTQFYNAVLVCANLRQASLMNASFLSGMSLILSRSEVVAMVLHSKRAGIAIYGDKNDIVIVRLASEVIEQRLIGHTKPIKSLALNPNKMLASGCEDGCISLWNLQHRNFTYLRYFTAHSSAVECLAFGPDDILASGCWGENVIYLWDTKRGGIYLRKLQGHTGMGSSFTFSNDGILASASQGYMDSTIRLWDIRRKDAYLKSLTGHKSVICLAFRKDGILASGDWDSTIYIWDPKREVSRLRELKGHMALVSSLAFDQSGNLVAGYQDGTIYLWYLKSEDVFFQIFSGHQDSISSLAFDLDGTLISSSKDSTIRLWESNPENIQLASSLDQQRDAATSGYNPLGMNARPDRHRWVRNFLGREEKEEPLHREQHADITGLAAGPGGMIVSIRKNGNICFWRLNKKNEIPRIFKSRIESIRSFAISLDGLLAVGDEEGAIHLLDSKLKTPAVKILKKQTEIILCLVFSSNGLLFSGGKNNGIIHIWSTQPETCYFRSLNSDMSMVSSLVLESDSMLVSGDNQGTIYLWDLSRQNEEPIKTFKARKYVSRFDFSYISSLAFNLDKIIASGHDDGTICLWDPNREPFVAHLKTLKEHTVPIDILSFSPDKLWLISGSDRAIVIWDTRNWNKAPRRFSFGSKSFCFNWPFLHLAHGEAVHTLDFSNFPPNLRWIMATAPSALWMQGCDITNAQHVSMSSKKLFKRSGAIGEPLEIKEADETTAISADFKQATRFIPSRLQTEDEGPSDEINIRDTIITAPKHVNLFTAFLCHQNAFEALKSKDYSQAAKLFEELISYYPDKASNYHNCACAYHLLGIQTENVEYFRGAEIYFKKAKELNPLSISIFVEYANFLRERRQYQDALNLLNQAIAMTDSLDEDIGGLSYSESELPALPKELGVLLENEERINFRHAKVLAYYFKIYCLCEQKQGNLQPFLDGFEALVSRLSKTDSYELYKKLLDFSHARCRKNNLYIGSILDTAPQIISPEYTDERNKDGPSSSLLVQQGMFSDVSSEMAANVNNSQISTSKFVERICVIS